MAKVNLFLCFNILFASLAILHGVSADLKIKPALPKIEDPKTVNDVEPYTIKAVMSFVSDLEKECPKTNKFKFFFDKLKGFAKYVCPLKKSDQKDYDQDMKAKATGLFQAISSFAVGKIKKQVQIERLEAINTFKLMKSLGVKIMENRKKNEKEESMKLTAEQQKEIKEGILKWETVIVKITNTMVVSTSTSSSGKDSKSGTSFKDTTGPNSNVGSPSGSPSPKSRTSFKDTTGGKKISPSGSPKKSPSPSSSLGRIKAN